MRSVHKTMMRAACMALLVGTGCGEESNPNDPDGGTPVDGHVADSGNHLPVDAGDVDAGDVDVDAGDVDAGTPPAYPTSRVVAFSETGTDQLAAAAWQADGAGFFACGFADPTSATTDDRSVLVARFHPNGALDASWGTGGSVLINVSGPGGRKVESCTGIVVQATGKLVLGGVVEHDVAATGALANDADGYVLRLSADGQVDTTFGEQGIRRLNFNDGVPNAANTGTSGADTVYNIALFADDSILVHGSQRNRLTTTGDGGVLPRTDNDWLAMKVTADGDVDTTWGGNDGDEPGKFTLDLGALESGNARTGVVLANGGVLGGGYTTYGGVQRPVLFKLDADGALDDTFGVNGVFNQTDILSTAAEAYGAAVQGTHYVTAGYGRDVGDPGARWLSFRLDGAGQIDQQPYYGTMGGTYHRFKSDVFGNGGNARSLVVLPDHRVLLVGGAARTLAPSTLPDGGAGPTTQTNATVGLLTEDGAPDTTFETDGFRDFDFGGPSDIFYAGVTSLSPAYASGACGRRVALVGNKGVSGTVTDDNNNDSAIVVLCFAP